MCVVTAQTIHSNLYDDTDVTQPAAATVRALAAAGHTVTMVFVATDDSVLPLESRWALALSPPLQCSPTAIQQCKSCES